MTDKKLTPEEKAVIKDRARKYARKIWADSRDFDTRINYTKADFAAGAECGYELAMERLAEIWDQACEKQREECTENLLINGMDSIATLDQDNIDTILDLIDNAPAPEFKLTEKE